MRVQTETLPKVYFYQCGRKTNLPDRIRPGVVVLLMAIRRAIEAGRREFDFLNGAAAYKTQLARQSRPVVELRAVRPSVLEQIRRLSLLACEPLRAAKRQLKRVVTPLPKNDRS